MLILVDSARRTGTLVLRSIHVRMQSGTQTKHEIECTAWNHNTCGKMPCLFIIVYRCVVYVYILYTNAHICDQRLAAHAHAFAAQVRLHKLIASHNHYHQVNCYKYIRMCCDRETGIFPHARSAKPHTHIRTHALKQIHQLHRSQIPTLY